MSALRNSSGGNSKVKIGIVVLSSVAVLAGGYTFVSNMQFGSSQESGTTQYITSTTFPTTAPRTPSGSSGGSQEAEGWVPEDMVRPSPPPAPNKPTCNDGSCNNGSDPAIQEFREQWLPIAEGFASEFGNVGNRTQQEWAEGLRPFVVNNLYDRFTKVNYGQAVAGSNPTIRVADESIFQSVVVRIDYIEGWSIYAEMQLLSVGQGWKVVSYDRATS